MTELIPIWMFAALFAFVFAGIPVAFIFDRSCNWIWNIGFW